MASRSCPGCSAPMRPFQAGAVELDRCPFCRGLWFDGGELEQVLGKKLVGALDNTISTSRRCAKCTTPMQPAVLGELRVEVCTTCRGVFLDDGELTKLNGGQKVRVQARDEAQVRDEVAGWLKSLGV